jgi:hypothetical protein
MSVPKNVETIGEPPGSGRLPAVCGVAGFSEILRTLVAEAVAADQEE